MEVKSVMDIFLKHFFQLPCFLRVILKSNTSIHWADRMFWEKLRFYLPPGATRPNHAHYSLPIYEVPHLPNHALGLQHKIYEQRTLESQLTAKLY